MRASWLIASLDEEAVGVCCDQQHAAGEEEQEYKRTQKKKDKELN
jgi:hypothetical protein